MSSLEKICIGAIVGVAAILILLGCSGLPKTKTLHLSQTISPVLKDEGEIDKVFLRWLVGGDNFCLSSSVLRNQLKETHHWFFLNRPERFRTCLQTHLFYDGDVLTTGDIQTCKEAVSPVQLADNLIEIKERAYEITKAYNNIVDSSAWSKFLSYNEPLSPFFSAIQVNDNTPKSILTQDFILRATIVESIQQESWFSQLIPKVENGFVSYWESNIYNKDSVLQSSFRIGKTPVNNQFNVFTDSLKIDLNISGFSAIAEAVKDEDIVALLVLNQQFKSEWQKQLKGYVNKEFKSIERLDNANFETRLIDLATICGCVATDISCLDNCKKKVAKRFKDSFYLQDEFHVRKSESENHLNFSMWHDNNQIDYDFVANYTSNICTDASSHKEPLRGIPGGNMFTIDKYLFLGKDELDKYLKFPELREFIGLQPGIKDVASIEKKLLESVFEDTAGKKVIWIGNAKRDTKRYRSMQIGQKFSQPIYHIDLFFHPIGRLNNGKFCYAFAMPFKSNSVGKENHTYLYDKMLEVKSRLEAELSKNDDIIVLNTFIKVEYEDYQSIRSYSRYLNVLSQLDNSKSQIDFLQPIVQDDLKNPLKTSLSNSRKMLNSQLTSEGYELKFTDVLGYYYHVDGLRCQVKVLNREY